MDLQKNLKKWCNQSRWGLRDTLYYLCPTVAPLCDVDADAYCSAPEATLFVSSQRLTQPVKIVDWDGDHGRHTLSWPTASPNIVTPLPGLLFILFVLGVARRRPDMATFQSTSSCRTSDYG
ncbi:hypothetical protein BJX76DRAFT_206090 [Aspergillus varians]